MGCVLARESIAKFVDELPSWGRYTFNSAELKNNFEKSDDAVKLALNRLQKKGRIICPRRGFYVVVPEQYLKIGAPPPIWFIDSLMKDWGADYYVGLLSAAELYGAAHHHPQEFQVVCNKAYREIHMGRSRLRFFKKWNVKDVPVIKHNTPTGQMIVSTPEATALDLVRYYNSVGYFDNVATILLDLSESMTPRGLVAAAKRGVELSVIQRLGYILDLLERNKLADALHEWLESQAPRITELRTDISIENAVLDKKWKLYVNEQIEADV